MSVTVYVDGWADVEFEMVKVYADEHYPSLEVEDFQRDIEMGTHFLEEETGRVYEMQRQPQEEYPHINLSTSNLMQIFLLAGMGHMDPTGNTDNTLSGERLDRFYKAILKAQNGSAKSRHDDDVIRDGNFFEFLPGESYFTRKLRHLMELIQFARQKGVGIYWA